MKPAAPVAATRTQRLRFAHPRVERGHDPVLNPTGSLTAVAVPNRVWDANQRGRIVLTGLTPGAAYGEQARAIGGSTGCSDWSNAVTIMAT